MVRRGDITGMADGSRFFLESARRIAAAIAPRFSKMDDTDILLKRLEEGGRKRGWDWLAAACRCDAARS